MISTPPHDRDTRTVLLTGATGFLGTFLLADLLRRSPQHAVCLVRAPSPGEALARVRRSLESYALWDDTFAPRISAACGNLAAPRLGLSTADFASLGARIDAIYHNGAAVSFLRSFDRTSFL